VAGHHSPHLSDVGEGRCAPVCPSHSQAPREWCTCELARDSLALKMDFLGEVSMRLILVLQSPHSMLTSLLVDRTNVAAIIV